MRTITSVTKSLTLGTLNWSRQGDLEIQRELGDAFNDDAVALNETDFDLVSSGSNHWDQSPDESTFVYEEITGDFDRVVRVEFHEPSSQWARAGLSARSSLDEGVTRAEAAAVETPMGANFTVRVNPVKQPDDAAGNNSYEVVSRPLPGLRYDPAAQPVQYRVVNGFGGAPPYPDAWMRLQRTGNVISYYRSDDGQAWSSPATSTVEDNPDTEAVELLPETLFVGIFYAPELNNNSTKTKVIRSTHAIFREYGKGPTETGTPTIDISGDGKITFTGKLLAADKVEGPYSEVTGATSPYAIPPGAAAKFFRSSQ